MRSLLPALLPVLLACGCWGGKFIDMPGRVETMEADQALLQAKIDSLRAAAEANEALLRSLQAVSGSRSTELVDQLSALTDEMELLLRRMSSGQGTSSVVSPGTDSVASPGDQTVFDESYLQYQQRNFPTAADGFLDLLDSSPGSPLADDALYFAALCHEAMALPHLAIEELVSIRFMFPESERAPAALSRAAAIYGSHGASTDRERLLRDIVELYPGTEEAALARSALGEE
jgi:TolA-binding protein